MASTAEVTNPWIGFWQVIYDDRDDEIVALPSLSTTVSLRRAGFSLYTQSWYIELRAGAGRRPAVVAPASEAERRAEFQSGYVGYGRCEWMPTDAGWTGGHQPVAGAGGMSRPGNERPATFDGDDATVGDERWRRLSGPGTSALAGAWAQAGPNERWTYLISAGHYAVVRESMNHQDGDLDRLRGNAGARVESERSFDHWPFIGGGAAFTARKHETFRVTTIEPNMFAAGFANDGSDAISWHRLESRVVPST